MKDVEYYLKVMIILIVENAILRNVLYWECHYMTLLKCVGVRIIDEAHHCH